MWYEIDVLDMKHFSSLQTATVTGGVDRAYPR